MQSIYWACLFHVVLVLATMAAAFIAACRIAPSAFCAGQKQRRLALGMPMAITFIGTLGVGLLVHFFLERSLFPDVPAAFMAQLSYSYVMLALCAACIAAMRASSGRAERALVETAAGLAASVAAPVAKSRRAAQGGFTLFELAMVLLILGLLTTMLLGASRGLINAARHRDVQSKLAVIDSAMLAFVAANGRLPCPADGSLASGAVNAGVEVRATSTAGGLGIGDCGTTVADQEIYGVVPWVALGISEAEVIDPWLGRFTYRVASFTNAAGNPNLSLTRNNAMNMTNCDPAGLKAKVSVTSAAVTIDTCNARSAVVTDCNQAGIIPLGSTCTSPLNFLIGRGLTIANENDTVIMDPLLGNGAAYVVISHSENLYGSLTPSGGTVIRTALGAATGPKEPNNRNGVVLQTSYWDAIQSQAVAAFFDDYISRPSVANIILKAQLWARPTTS